MKAVGKKPDFIGVGAQKAGTSWIHACLYEHPHIYMPASKELHFFSNFYAQGVAWYEAQFQACPRHQIAGEFSPTYLYHPDAPKRIHDYNPYAKLIICLRDPIARTVSAYRYAIQTGAIAPTITLADVIRTHPAYAEHGLYAGQIKRYLQHFSREQILIMIYEDIASAPYQFMRTVYRFLGVDEHFRPTMAERKVNVSRGIPRIGVLDHLLQRLAAFCRRAGFGHLAWTIGRSRPMDIIQRLNRRVVAQQPLPEEQLEALQQFFTPDVQALVQVLGQEVPANWHTYRHAVET